MKAWALILVLALIVGCGRTGTSPNPGGPIPVVATTTVLADIVARVGGDRVEVSSLVPKGGEVHTFDPSPQDVGRLTDARLIVANGLGLDDWLSGLARDSGTTAPIASLGDALAGDEIILEDDRPNPHAWLDPRIAILYGRTAAEALARLDPEGADAYTANADALATQLTMLDDRLHARFDEVPPEKRRIVSFHDALPYFARAFDVEVIGTIIEAPGQDPSAADLARLIDEIRRTGVKAIVSEVQFPDELARTIAAETGATVVSDLYTDTLGNPPVDSYEAMLTWDVDRLVEALR